MDSGGFTARQQDISPSIKEYIQFLLTIPKNNMVYANLDTSSTEESLSNQKEMEKAGLHPLPVFHFSEYRDGRLDLLQEWCKKYSYIAIGGVAKVGLTPGQQKRYLNTVFHYTKDKIKLHGFGITGQGVLEEYPFYSADSTTWLSGGRYGKVVTANGIEGTKKNYIGMKSKEKDYVYLYRKGIEETLKLQEHITSLWDKRGVKWTE